MKRRMQEQRADSNKHPMGASDGTRRLIMCLVGLFRLTSTTQFVQIVKWFLSRRVGQFMLLSEVTCQVGYVILAIASGPV